MEGGATRGGVTGGVIHVTIISLGPCSEIE